MELQSNISLRSVFSLNFLKIICAEIFVWRNKNYKWSSMAPIGLKTLKSGILETQFHLSKQKLNCRLGKYNERVREGEIERVRQPGIGKAFAMPNPRPNRPETWGWAGTMLKT